MSLALENGNKLEDVTEDKSSLPIQSIIESIPLANSDAAQAEPTEEDMFRNLVIAQVDSYVNVRSTSSEEGEILGKLYDNSVGTFISEENGWYQINSGSVTGYVKAEYCVTGDAAVEIAKQVGKRIATVTTETLYVRAEASTECDIIGMVTRPAGHGGDGRLGEGRYRGGPGLDFHGICIPPQRIRPGGVQRGRGEASG